MSRSGPEIVEAREDPLDYVVPGPLLPAVRFALALVYSGAFEAERDETGQNVAQGNQFEGSLNGLRLLAS